jgi:hypothetical protein
MDAIGTAPLVQEGPSIIDNQSCSSLEPKMSCVVLVLINTILLPSLCLALAPSFSAV